MSAEWLSKMGSELQVKSFWFYLTEDEKIKLNWFLYEYACSLYEHMRGSRKKTLSKWRSKWSDGQVAEFCAYFSKRMRQSVNKQLAGLTRETEIYEEYVSDYYHTNTRRENNAIINVAGEAWAELLETCEVCPCRCISERNEQCGFFDRMGQE